MSGPPEFSVVIPVYNAIRYLPSSLEAVRAAIRHYGDGRVAGAGAGAVELIVVDNGSTDGSWELLRERYGSAATLMREPSATVGRLRNLGAGRSRGRWLSFVDADCVIPGDYFHRAAAVLAAGGADATGSRYALPTDPPPRWIERTWHELHWRPGDGYVPYVPAGNFIVSRAAFEAVGGFREALATGEDAELCQRLGAAGYRIYEAQSVVAEHLGNPKTLRAFFRQQVWHGLGQFGTVRRAALDKPVAMTALHGLLTLAGCAGLALGPGPAGARVLAAAVLTAAAPAATVLFRARRRGLPAHPLQALLLYHLYYDARLWAALRTALGRTTYRR